MTYHARKEMQEDGFAIYDVERGILTEAILERQHDRVARESKYRIREQPLTGLRSKSWQKSVRLASLSF
jgi:hypothetical protein